MVQRRKKSNNFRIQIENDLKLMKELVAVYKKEQKCIPANTPERIVEANLAHCLQENILKANVPLTLHYSYDDGGNSIGTDFENHQLECKCTSEDHYTGETNKKFSIFKNVSPSWHEYLRERKSFNINKFSNQQKDNITKPGISCLCTSPYLKKLAKIKIGPIPCCKCAKTKKRKSKIEETLDFINNGNVQDLSQFGIKGEKLLKRKERGSKLHDLKDTVEKEGIGEGMKKGSQFDSTNEKDKDKSKDSQTGGKIDGTTPGTTPGDQSQSKPGQASSAQGQITGQPSSGSPTPAKSQSAAAQGQPGAAQGQSGAAQGQSSAAQGQSSAAQGQSAAAQGQSAAAKGLPALGNQPSSANSPSPQGQPSSAPSAQMASKGELDPSSYGKTDGMPMKQTQIGSTLSTKTDSLIKKSTEARIKTAIGFDRTKGYSNKDFISTRLHWVQERRFKFSKSA